MLDDDNNTDDPAYVKRLILMDMPLLNDTEDITLDSENRLTVAKSGLSRTDNDPPMV